MYFEVCVCLCFCTCFLMHSGGLFDKQDVFAFLPCPHLLQFPQQHTLDLCWLLMYTRCNYTCVPRTAASNHHRVLLLSFKVGNRICKHPTPDITWYLALPCHLLRISLRYHQGLHTLTNSRKTPFYHQKNGKGGGAYPLRNAKISGTL